MKVRCIDDKKLRNISITEGKVYSVLGTIDGCYMILNDDGEEECYLKCRFEEVEEVEKEKVLEVEFQDVFDKVAWRIVYQNEDVLSRDFEDREIGVKNVGAPFFDYNGLCLKGRNEQGDDRILLVDKEEAEIIKQKVEAINEKYGIPKRWRAKEGDEYWYIHMSSELNCFPDREGGHAPLGSNPFRHENRYNRGNYFRTREEALSKLHEIEKIFAE